MRKNSFLGFLAVVALSVSLTACKDTKTLQENEQLKTQVAELQKENGQLGNQIEALTAARHSLTQQTAALQRSCRKGAPGPKPPAASAAGVESLSRLRMRQV